MRALHWKSILICSCITSRLLTSPWWRSKHILILLKILISLSESQRNGFWSLTLDNRRSLLIVWVNHEWRQLDLVLVEIEVHRSARPLYLIISHKSLGFIAVQIRTLDNHIHWDLVFLKNRVELELLASDWNLQFLLHSLLLLVKFLKGFGASFVVSLEVV